MTTLRERRYRQTVNTIARLMEQRELAFRRLAIITDRLKEAKAYLRRADKEKGRDWKPEPLPKAPEFVRRGSGSAVKEWVPPAPELEPVDPFSDDLAIPDFLKRDAADAKAREEIAAEKEARAKAKRDAKDAIPASRKLGPDAAKMPLMGRDALKVLKRLRGG